MRTLTLLITTTTLLFAAACDVPPDADSHRKAAVATMNDRAWSNGDVTVLDSLLADSVRFHYNGAPARTMSRQQLAGGILAWREAFPDLRMETLDLVAEDDRVAGRFRLTGTHRGPWRGVEPTGVEVELALLMFFRFEDGQVTEMWEVDDQLGFRQQLGVIP